MSVIDRGEYGMFSNMMFDPDQTTPSTPSGESYVKGAEGVGKKEVAWLLDVG